MYGTTLANFCQQISLILDRDVIDKTGIAGVFDIRVEPLSNTGTADGASPAPSPGAAGASASASLTDPLGSSVLAAARTAGLRLESAKGPGDFLVIDHVEKPTGN
jgi:uncharacterized protein (TIGR03435 family)